MTSVKSAQSPQPSIKAIRKQKFLLVLPVLILPFTIFLLWTLGLIGDVEAKNNSAKQTLGLNIELPSAAPAKDSNWNKMKYYEQADKDSARLKTLIKSDPYRRLDLSINSERIDSDTLLASSRTENRSPYTYDRYPKSKIEDYNEQRVYKRIAAIDKQLESSASKEQTSSVNKVSRIQQLPANNPDVDRLEKMMESMERKPEEDPELNQLNELLEKVIDVQHPERIEDKIKQQSVQNKRRAFSVQSKREDIFSTIEMKRDWHKLLQDEMPDTTISRVQAIFDKNRFHSLEDAVAENDASNAIVAVVRKNQTVMNGATLQLELHQEIFVNGILIPKSTLVSGLVSLKGTRLYVTVESICFKNSVFPVDLSVYAKDGLPGLPLDASALNDAAKMSMRNSLQAADLDVLNQSIGAQVANAGIQAAKTLADKKSKLIKMTVPAGYTVLLVDGNGGK